MPCTTRPCAANTKEYTTRAHVDCGLWTVVPRCRTGIPSNPISAARRKQPWRHTRFGRRPADPSKPRQIRKIRRSPDGETKSDGIHSVARWARHSDRSSRRAEDEAANGRTRNGTDQTTRPVRRLVVRASATRRRRQKAGQRQPPPPVSTRRKQRTRRLLVPVVVLSWIGTWRAAGSAPRRAEPRRVASTREATPLHSSTPVSPLRLRAALDRAPPQHLSACTLWPSTCFPSAHAAAVVVVGIHYSFGHEHTAMPYVMPCNQPHVVQIH